MQVERCRIITQWVLRQRRDTDYSSNLVHMFDALLCPAQIRVGHRRAITEIQLDVGSYGVALKPTYHVWDQRHE